MNEMDEEQISEYRDAFSMFDKNSDGLISTSELGAVMHSLGLSSNEAEIQAMIRKVDINKNGAIDFPEFLMLMAIKKSAVELEEELLQAFWEFDGDRNGLITREELQVTLAKFGEIHSDGEIGAMITEIDVDGDGMVDYSEFLKMMVLSN